ncbi:MAG: NADH-quinone oxidoreductase subunit I [Sandaracinaceae bacterium]|nr:NADH-quinone oxidoreductase subunit I [Sandaracinaceae bacterium]
MATYKIHKPARTFGDQAYLPAIAKGLVQTFGRLYQNLLGPEDQRKTATVCYPDEVREYPERFRGVHRLTHRADGSPRCVACLCCSTACPAQCIYIEPAEYEADERQHGYERYPKVFVIDELRCIFCGFCVEACPCDAIRMDTGVHVPASYSREHFLFDKETLLSIPGRDGSYVTANVRLEPGDPGHPGIDREHGH